MTKRPIHRIDVDNFLSFRKAQVDLRPLNVLVGPNGSGKSNFLKIFDFIGDVAERDLETALEAYGGLESLRFTNFDPPGRISLRIRGVITKFASYNALDDYKLTLFPAARVRGKNKSKPPDTIAVRIEEFKTKRVRGKGRRITLSGGELTVFQGRASDAPVERKQSVKEQTSGLSLLRRLGEEYEAAQVEEIASLFEDLRLIDIDVKSARKEGLARNSERLNHDGSNIAPFLLRLREQHPEAFHAIEEDVRFVLPTFEEFKISRRGGDEDYVRLDVKETCYKSPLPIGRISFGTMRAVVLFAMLHDPAPPKLTCVEEIDHGFHPQALDRLVERLREATERTQLVVATHSPALVNRLEPSELIMFTRESDGSTQIVRPDPEIVSKMSERSGYRLGELWFSGLLDE